MLELDPEDIRRQAAQVERRHPVAEAARAQMLTFSACSSGSRRTTSTFCCRSIRTTIATCTCGARRSTAHTSLSSPRSGTTSRFATCRAWRDGRGPPAKETRARAARREGYRGRSPPSVRRAGRPRPLDCVRRQTDHPEPTPPMDHAAVADRAGASDETPKPHYPVMTKPIRLREKSFFARHKGKLKGAAGLIVVLVGLPPSIDFLRPKLTASAEAGSG